MTKQIILYHLKFLEMFKWFMTREILTTKHKTPIQYNNNQKAKMAYYRVLRKGVHALCAKCGFRSKTDYSSIVITLTNSQRDKYYVRNTKHNIKYNIINVNYYHLRYRRTIRIGINDYRTRTFTPTNFLNMIEADLKQLSELSGTEKPIIKPKVIQKPSQTKEQKDIEKKERLEKEQILFDAVLQARIKINGRR